jgi:hypothetical protein
MPQKRAHITHGSRMNDEKSFPYWSPKSSGAVIAWHWAEYLVFFDDAIGEQKYFFMQNAAF